VGRDFVMVICDFSGILAQVLSAQFSSDSTLVITASGDGFVRAFDVATGTSVASRKCPFSVSSRSWIKGADLQDNKIVLCVFRA